MLAGLRCVRMFRGVASAKTAGGFFPSWMGVSRSQNFLRLGTKVKVRFVCTLLDL
jgi:hypothetical protein